MPTTCASYVFGNLRSKGGGEGRVSSVFCVQWAVRPVGWQYSIIFRWRRYHTPETVIVGTPQWFSMRSELHVIPFPNRML